MKWLFLLHQVRSKRSRDRVKVWRFTQKAGAVLYRNSVYVLPDSPERREDFQWLCQQIRDSQGDASVFASEANDAAEDKVLRSLFVRAAEDKYAALLSEAERLEGRVSGAQKERRLTERLLKSLAREAHKLNGALDEAARTDFFGAASARVAQTTMAELTRRLASFQPHGSQGPDLKRYRPGAFQGRTWATRAQIHIDRLCSAWLIRRFIDPRSKFVFAPESRLPKDAVLFDVFGAEFGHHGEDCTFETLLKAFGLKDASLKALAQIVHDIDLKDQKFGRAEAAGLDLVVRALGHALKDDHAVLDAGSSLLDALYKQLSA